MPRTGLRLFSQKPGLLPLYCIKILKGSLSPDCYKRYFDLIKSAQTRRAETLRYAALLEEART